MKLASAVIGGDTHAEIIHMIVFCIAISENYFLEVIKGEELSTYSFAWYCSVRFS